MMMNDLGTPKLLEVVPYSFRPGAMKSTVALNRSGFFSVIRVIVAGPWPPAGLIQDARNDMIRHASR